MAVPLSQQIACVARELRIREGVYPKWVKAGRMKLDDAEHEIAAMKSVLATLEQLREPDMSDAQVQAVTRIVAQIKPLLAGKGPDVQGAVLADLLAIWLAGHVSIGDPDKTRKARAELLSIHLAAVRQLVVISDRANADA